MFRTVGLDYIADQDPTPLDFLEQTCREGQLLVAAVGNRVAGFVATSLIDGDLHIEELDVHPDFARQGVGTALMEFVCSNAKAAGRQRATLSTFIHVPWNRPYYAKLGFEDLPLAEMNAEPFAAMRRLEADRGHDISQRTIMGKLL